MPNGPHVALRRIVTRRGSVTASAWSLVLVGAVVAGCASPPPPAQEPEVLSIGVLAPLTGEQAESGIGVLEAVEAVVAERADDLQEAGIDLRVVPLDDRGLQGVGQQQATVLADDPTAIGVVGSTDSVVDEGVQPILAEAGVPQLSLGGSRPLLVQGAAGGARFPSYATYAARSTDRALVASTFVERGGRIAVLVGPRREDRVLARTFERAAEKAGGRIVLVRTVGTAPSETADAVARAGLRSALDAVEADVVYAPVEPTRTWDVVADVRTVEPRATLVLDEAALGRWSDALDRERADAERRGVRWGPTRVVVTGYGSSSSGDAPTPSPGTAETQPVGRFAAQGADAARRLVDAVLAPSTGAAEGPEQIRARIIDAYPRTLPGALGPYRFLAPGFADRRLVGAYARGVDRWLPEQGFVAVGRCATLATCTVEPWSR